MSSTPRSATAGWWRDAVVYQLYIRSFADADGDGTGDIGGVRSRLDHLVDLGVDALWVNPWYPSPQADAGYDVADFRDIDPLYGTLDDADALVARRARGGAARCCSTSCPTTPRRSTRGSAPRWRATLTRAAATTSGPVAASTASCRPTTGRATSAGRPGPATTDPDGRPGDWYLHLFAPEQPDLDWENPEVRGEFEDVLRFWFDRGVDGFRIDVAHGLAKQAGPPRRRSRLDRQHRGPAPRLRPGRRPRHLPGVAARSPTPTTRRGSSWPSRGRRAASGSRSTSGPTSCTRRSSSTCSGRRSTPGDEGGDHHLAARHRGRRRQLHLGAVQPRRGPPGHPLRPLPAAGPRRRPLGPQALARGAGRPRARPAPGPGRRPADAGAARGRLPLPGRGARPPRGRGPARRPAPGPDLRPLRPASTSAGTAAASRCPGTPAPRRTPSARRAARSRGSRSRRTGPACRWPPRTADPDSTLELYRSALRLRREHLVDAGPLDWLDTPPGTLAFRRGALTCWLNTSDQPVALPGGRLLLGSVPGMDGRSLPVDAAAWVDTT